MRHAFVAACAVSLTSVCTAYANWNADIDGKALTVKSVKSIIEQQACASTTIGDEAELALSIDPINLGEAEDVAKALPPKARFLGGWHLTHSDPRFGGFSGLSAINEQSLLAISDKGYFLILEIEGIAPKTTASLFPMLSESGQSLVGKKRSDAEGLAYKDGIAYVSFEHQHRIGAFDIARCGAQATAVKLTSLPDEIGKKAIKPNNGAEALHINIDGEFIAGYETVIKNYSPRITLGSGENIIAGNAPIKTPFGFKMVGESENTILLRAYNPILGNRTAIEFKDSDQTISLAPPLAVDNFEGITEKQTRTGERIIYIISDNNFSKKQRTLLYAFKLPS